MTLHTRRALRATAVMAGVAALGATFSGTALAADEDSGSAFSSADREAGGYLGSDGDTGGYFGDEDGGYLDGSDFDNDSGYFSQDGSKDGIGNGSLSGFGGDMVPFNFPSRGPSMTVPVKKKDDDRSPISPYAGFGHHDHHGASDPYDYDLYQPTEHYDANKCEDHGSSRAPFYASDIAGDNGDSSDDCKVDSSDYHPKRTGFRGDYDPNGDQGYNGYLGSKDKKLDKNDYGFGAI